MNLDKINITEVGNYVVLMHINPEGLSKTFKVKHKFTEEIFAMKVVFAEDPTEVTKLEQTYKRLTKGITKLASPNLIGFNEYFVTEVEGQKCFVQISEFFVGKELEAFILAEENQGLKHNEIKNVFDKISHTVNEIHQLKLVDDHGVETVGFPHGDITPWNIMINKDLDVRLLDFKLSNRFTVSGEKKQNDKFGSIVPEQRNSKTISKSADIFQLGYLLYYLFTNDHNYYNWNLDEKSTQDIFQILDSEKSGKLKKKLSQVIYKCTRKDPKDRYPTIQAMIDDLENKKSGAIKINNKILWGSIAAFLATFVIADIVFIKYFIPTPQEASSMTRGATPKADANHQSDAVIGEFYAYMIANENYSNLKKLSRPVQDVNTLHKILVNDYGFKEENIIQTINASRNDFYDGFEKVSNRVKKNDNLIVFYAGHGQLDGDTGYWIPVEGKENSRRDWISNSEIKKFLSSIVAKNVLVVSDACFGGSLLRDVGTYKSKEAGRISNKRSRIALTSGSLESVPDQSIFIDQFFWYLENNSDSLVYVSNIFSGIREAVVSNTTTDPGYGPIRDAGHQGGDFFFIKQKQGNKVIQ